MTDHIRHISFLPIWVLALILTVEVARGLPLERENDLASSASLSRGNTDIGLRDLFPVVDRPLSKRSLESSFIRTADAPVSTHAAPETETPARTARIIDHEPRCLLHHEYAEILRKGYDGSDPRVRSFINRRGEVRHYICLPCRICPTGVRILSPCHRKRDTICSTECVDPDYEYDVDRQICIPQIPSPSTTPVASLSDTRFMIWTTAGNLFVVDESTGDNNINDQVHLPVTASPPSHKALVPQITLITVGVVTLNMLAIAGVVIMYKRSKCKKWHKRPRSGCFNNALSTPRLRATPSASQPTSVENQVDNRQNVTSDDAGVSSTSRATSGEVNTSGRYLPHSELIPQRAKESNLNVFCEPGYERGSDTSLATPQEGVATRALVQVLQGSDPYRLVMIGQFGPEGGVLACEDSDVILEIPPGAIPADHGSQTIVAKVSLRPDIAGPKLKDSDSLWLTPLVEFESPGLERFNKDVRMRLPHCAHMKPGWTFRVNYTNPTAATNSNPGNFNQEPESDGALLPDDAKSQSQWFFVEHKCTLTKSGKSCRRVSEEGGDVTFTVDEKYFNISTSHFSKYSCSGCHKEHPLHLEAVVYWNHTKVEGREQMDLNVYILDPIKDSRAHVKENERGSECHTGYYPLILGYKKKNKETSPLEISVQEDCMGDHWKWRLDTYNGCLPAKKVFPIQSLIRCCSPLLFSRQTFSFSPKNPAEVKELTLFQAIICVKQQNWPKGEPTHILVTVPLSAKKLTGSYLNASNKEEGVVTDAHIQLVEEKLSVKKWRPLYRRLMGDGADVGIEHIAARYPDNTAEQIHEALVSWRKSLGRLATLRDLTSALEAVGQKDIAEDLRQPKEIKYELIIHDDSQSVCQETHV